MDKKSIIENKLVPMVSDLEKETLNLAQSKVAWVKPSIKAFSIWKKTEGGGGVNPEFIAGALS